MANVSRRFVGILVLLVLSFGLLLGSLTAQDATQAATDAAEGGRSETPPRAAGNIAAPSAAKDGFGTV